MQRLALLSILTAMALPALAVRPLTVEQLRQMLIAKQAANESDGELARKIGSVELTEQLTAPTLTQLMTDLKLGQKTASALNLLADSSAFLEPPASESISTTPPDVVTQRAMINTAVTYVAETIRQLPNFLATRVTRSFDNSPAMTIDVGRPPTHTELHLVGIYKREITYRNGREVVDDAVPAADSKTKTATAPSGLSSRGEFGPILATILTDSVKGKVSWSHWERMSTGRAAVFAYEVPKEASHYAVNYCCARNPSSPDPLNLKSDTPVAYAGTPPYHGSIYLDPTKGTILRVTLEAELRDSDPIVRNDISVQYGPVELGDKSYFCPVRSVAISWVGTVTGESPIDGPILRINEVTFTAYHRFRSTMRVLTSPPDQ